MTLLLRIRTTMVLATVLSLSGTKGSLPSGRQAPAVDPAQEYQIYVHARPVIDWTIPEITSMYPEFKKLHFSETQEELEPLLQGVAANVEAFFKDFPNTASTEHVRRERRRNTGDFEDRVDQKFNYIVLRRPEGSGSLLEEDRSGTDASPAKSRSMPGANLLTTGYASISLLFHARFQAYSRFRYLGVTEGKPGYHVIGFAQKPEGQGMSGLFNGVEASGRILVQGLAWVDPGNYQIIRMRTDLLAPRPDLGLSREITEVRFSEIHFNSISRSLFLPSDVLVTIEHQGHLYINRHRYTDYHLFTVETYEKRERPVAP